MMYALILMAAGLILYAAVMIFIGPETPKEKP